MRPSKVIAKAFRAGFQRVIQRCRPFPVGSRSDEALAATAIPGELITSAIRRMAAHRIIALFDCCHAGGIGQPKEASSSEFRSGLPERFYNQLQSGRGRAIIASSRADELSWVMPGAPHSVFTLHLVTGLRGAAAAADGVVRIFDLFEYVQPRVTADQPRQHPIFKADLEDNFPVVAVEPQQQVQLHGNPPEQRFRYDAYISYVDKEPDRSFVWDELIPRVEASALRVAVSGDVEHPGVARVVSIERGITMSRRVVVVLSRAYANDTMADFENVLAQTMGIQENRYRLLPVILEDIEDDMLPLRLRMLSAVRFYPSHRAQHNYPRLVTALQAPLPRRIGSH